jgi:hypothetical protein
MTVEYDEPATPAAHEIHVLRIPRPRPERTLGVRLTLDVHLLDDESSAMTRLRNLHRDGWIHLVRASVMDLETARASDPAKRAELQRSQDEFVEEIGVWILGQSRLGVDTMAGSDDDGGRWDRLWPVLFPNKDRRSTNDQTVRDAMHIDTAMRYGSNAFLTREKQLVARAEAVAAAFDHFGIWTPEHAVDVVNRLKHRHDARAAR